MSATARWHSVTLTIRAALRTSSRAELISARDLAMSETTVPTSSNQQHSTMMFSMLALTVLVKLLPESHPRRVRHTQDHRVKRHLGNANRPHAVMNAARTARSINYSLQPSRAKNVPKTALNDLEPATPAEYEVRERHAHVVVDDLVVALGCVVVPKNRHRAHEAHARRVRWHDYNTLALVRVRVVRCALAHHDVHLTAWVTCTADPPASTFRCLTAAAGQRGYHLCPLITMSFPSWRIDVWIFVASDEATVIMCSMEFPPS
jgi:hypothetical protein